MYVKLAYQMLASQNSVFIGIQHSSTVPGLNNSSGKFHIKKLILKNEMLTFDMPASHLSQHSLRV